MLDPERQQLTLKIASERIVTTVFRKDEAQLKAVEANVNNLWERWRLQHPSKTDKEVLAMVAFQYAKLYYDIEKSSKKREEELLEFIKTFEEKMNGIILDV